MTMRETLAKAIEDLLEAISVCEPRHLTSEILIRQAIKHLKNADAMASCRESGLLIGRKSQQTVEAGDYVLDVTDPDWGYSRVESVSADGVCHLANGGVMQVTDIADIKLESEITG